MQPSPQRKAAPRLLALFGSGALVALVVSVFAVSTAIGTLGVSSRAWSALATGLAMCIALLVLSRALQRAGGEPFTTLGLSFDRNRRREFMLGLALGIALFLGVASVQSAMVGAQWEFAGPAGVIAAAPALGVTFVLVLVEELLFRGVALRQLRAMYGDWTAILLSALLFGAYHLVQSGDWAMGAVFTFLMPCLGGVLFGYSAVKSNGLALPLGLHLGGNWVQAALAGFAPVGSEASQAVWRISISATDVRTLTAPDLLPRLPYIAAVVIAALVVWALSQSHGSGARTT